MHDVNTYSFGVTPYGSIAFNRRTAAVELFPLAAAFIAVANDTTEGFTPSDSISPRRCIAPGKSPTFALALRAMLYVTTFTRMPFSAIMLIIHSAPSLSPVCWHALSTAFMVALLTVEGGT